MSVQAALDSKHRAEAQADERKAREQRSSQRFAAAFEWAQQVGFPASLQQLAASSAMALQQLRGEGAVTKSAVDERMRCCWPEIFDEQAIEQAA